MYRASHTPDSASLSLSQINLRRGMRTLLAAQNAYVYNIIYILGRMPGMRFEQDAYVTPMCRETSIGSVQ